VVGHEEITLLGHSIQDMMTDFWTRRRTFGGQIHMRKFKAGGKLIT